MKVKLNIPICGPDGSFAAGQEANISDATAKGLIEAGHASKIPEIVVKAIIADEISGVTKTRNTDTQKRRIK